MLFRTQILNTKHYLREAMENELHAVTGGWDLNIRVNLQDGWIENQNTKATNNAFVLRPSASCGLQKL